MFCLLKKNDRDRLYKNIRVLNTHLDWFIFGLKSKFYFYNIILCFKAKLHHQVSKWMLRKMLPKTVKFEKYMEYKTQNILFIRTMRERVLSVY